MLLRSLDVDEHLGHTWTEGTVPGASLSEQLRQGWTTAPHRSGDRTLKGGKHTSVATTCRFLVPGNQSEKHGVVFSPGNSPIRVAFIHKHRYCVLGRPPMEQLHA